MPLIFLPFTRKTHSLVKEISGLNLKGDSKMKALVIRNAFNIISSKFIKGTFLIMFNMIALFGIIAGVVLLGQPIYDVLYYDWNWSDAMSSLAIFASTLALLAPVHLVLLRRMNKLVNRMNRKFDKYFIM